MKILPSEIKSIEEMGDMNGAPVKLIRTLGGFYICVGATGHGKREEALAAGSHPAIVKYNLEKAYPNFRPALMKSEAQIDLSVVNKHTKFLSEDLQKSGHDLYSIQNGTNIEFQLTKQNVKIGSVQAKVEDSDLIVNNIDISEEFSSALANAVGETASILGVNRIGIKGK